KPWTPPSTCSNASLTRAREHARRTLPFPPRPRECPVRQVLAGTVGARGMALGRARRVQSTRIRIDPTPLTDDEVQGELDLLHQALETAREELLNLRDKLQGSMAREATDFVDAHSMLLSDPDLL